MQQNTIVSCNAWNYEFKNPCINEFVETTKIGANE
jgi:hypothetical protein